MGSVLPLDLEMFTLVVVVVDCTVVGADCTLVGVVCILILIIKAVIGEVDGE